MRPEPTAIIHDDVPRSMDVTASVTGDPADVTAAVRAALATVPMPYEYHAEVLGNAVIRQDYDLRGLAYGGVALVGVFLLLQAGGGALAPGRACCWSPCRCRPPAEPSPR